MLHYLQYDLYQDISGQYQVIIRSLLFKKKCYKAKISLLSGESSECHEEKKQGNNAPSLVLRHRMNYRY